MFLQVSVILFTGGGGCLLPGGGAWSKGGIWSRGGLVETPLTATATDGTHPTGMHSC